MSLRQFNDSDVRVINLLKRPLGIHEFSGSPSTMLLVYGIYYVDFDLIKQTDTQHLNSKFSSFIGSPLNLSQHNPF